MSTAIVPFQYQCHEVRTQTDEHGQPWFIAVDLCTVLGIANSRDALSSLDADEKGVANTDTPGGAQQLATVNEPGMYSLVLRSRKPEAKAFKRWLTHEVIPSIRKTGGYGSSSTTDVVATMDRKALAMLVIEAEEAKERAEAVAEKRQAVIDVYDSTKGSYSVREVSKVLAADHSITIGERKLYRLLSADLRWMYQDGRGQWQPYAKHRDYGRLLLKPQTYETRDGERKTAKSQVRITHKGLTDLVQTLTKRGGAQLAIIEGGVA